MQTFLPYENFKKTASCLDFRRLGKQRVEAWQILRILKANQKVGCWVNHPTVIMWKGHEEALAAYCWEICEEWIRRGYKDTIEGREELLIRSWCSSSMPDWLGDPNFHSAHRAALLAKDFKWYSQFKWKEKPEIKYIWPKTKEK